MLFDLKKTFIKKGLEEIEDRFKKLSPDVKEIICFSLGRGVYEVVPKLEEAYGKEKLDKPIKENLLALLKSFKIDKDIEKEIKKLLDRLEKSCGS